MPAVALGLLLLLVSAGPLAAEQWGAIVPGESTMQDVRTRYGGPSRTTVRKTDGYDTAQWVYESAQAPGGVRRLTVDFGLLAPAGFRAEVVRSFVLEPKPGAFTRWTVVAGWGPPHGIGKEGQSQFYFYKEGLFVYFESTGDGVTSMVFTPPQSPPAEKVEPRR